MVNRSITIALVLLTASVAAAQTIGPKSGSLVIVGGNMQDPDIVKRFIDLAGGPEAPIVIIPTAGEDDENYHEYWSGLRQWRENGARNLTVLHTRDRKVSDTEAFVKPIQSARGVFFAGGRQWRLADAYLHTRVHRELQALLDRGGVIGGSSAGATILGSFLVRGDTKGNEDMIGDHVEGMAFLKNSAIDQHLLRRNRHFDLIQVIEKHPTLLGIGLDENTAIVVRGDEFDVIGKSYVVIYDNKALIPPAGRFYFLAPGDRYDLVKREASRASQQHRPLGVTKPGKWPGQP